MIYSVFNWSTQQYDYYQGSGIEPGDKVIPRVKSSGGNKKVAAKNLEDLLICLPSDAIRVGSGKDAKGQVATRIGDTVQTTATSSGLGSEFFRENPWFSVGIAITGFFVFYRVMLGAVKRL